MVGKGEVKSSRIFHQCYVKCCKLQNLTPLNIILPSSNGKVLDFCVDRIKYVDWPPILNALSCDLSLHSVSIKCRQQVKTVLEHIDCERLAKTVNKRAVILTNFMLSNLIEAISQLLSHTTLLVSLLLEGLPMKIPYLNPICDVKVTRLCVGYTYLNKRGLNFNTLLAVLLETTKLEEKRKALLANSSLQHLYLPRCLIGDSGCMAICKAVRCLPNILTMDLSGCELTPLGAGYIAELIKYQKIHRYSENWIHTLRYRLPELDTMAGLRRISLCGNPQLGDAGVGKLFDVLADDLWIKAVDIQNCGVTEDGADLALQMMRLNTTLVILDMRHNSEISSDSLAKLRMSLRQNERGMGGQYPWLGNVSSGSSNGRPPKQASSKNGIVKERAASKTRNASNKYSVKSSIVKKERDYSEVLEEQLQEEISHRQQLEELNLQLVEQMKRLKQHQIQLWANGATSSGSEQSFQTSSRSGEQSNSSGSSSIPIDQNTLSYIQQAFKDIYAFIKNNQCHGQCLDEEPEPEDKNEVEAVENVEVTDIELKNEYRVVSPKRAQSTHVKLVEKVKKKKITKSAHLLGELQTLREERKPEIIERQVGDVRNAHGDDVFAEVATHKDSKKDPYKDMYERSSQSSVSDSSDTLVCSPAPNPRLALFTSSDEDE